jgi:colanic acid biosynthesis glycosyl transferase WcaI
MPSKVYEIMASGRPVLASADTQSDLWNLVATTQCGICIEPHNALKLAAAVMTLYEDAPLRLRMGERGRLEAEGAYSLEAVVRKYDELIGSIDRRREPSTGLVEDPVWH